MHLDLSNLITTISYPGIGLIIFAETGLLVGFFLPGDSLLITAGLLLASGILKLPWVLLALFVGSVLGNNLGYWWGGRLGPGLSSKVHPDHMRATEAFLKRFGRMALLIGPFVPVVRTVMPFLSGAVRFRWRTFFVLNLLGSLFWTQGVTLSGYYLGRVIPHLDRYILLVIGGVIVMSLIPLFIQLLRHRYGLRRGNRE